MIDFNYLMEYTKDREILVIPVIYNRILITWSWSSPIKNLLRQVTATELGGEKMIVEKSLGHWKVSPAWPDGSEVIRRLEKLLLAGTKDYTAAKAGDYSIRRLECVLKQATFNFPSLEEALKVLHDFESVDYLSETQRIENGLPTYW